MEFRPQLIPERKLKRWYELGFTVPLIVPFRSAEEPWTLVKRVLDSKHVFFLDSVNCKTPNARYSYFGWNPYRIIRLSRLRNPVPVLRNAFRSFRGRRWKGIPFFTGGAVGYLSYELARTFEKLPDLSRDDLGFSPMTFFLVRDLVAFDHKASLFYLISNLIPKTDGSFESAARFARERQTTIERRIFATHRSAGAEVRIRNFKADLNKRKFVEMVKRAKRHIKAGDIYQANLSQRFSFEFSGDPASLYESLRAINPSPFSSFLKMKDFVVAGSSPELLIRKRGSLCETRPIAGTRPRGRTRAEEKRLGRELLRSPKERAEHLMLVDLERNDLGRVSRPHSVRVNEFMTLERYSHVLHIVSNVRSRLASGFDQFDLLQAVFPGGTITGCPKIRSMEIIEALEPFKRHLYTGSIGYLDFNGDLALNIVIRTLILKGAKGYFQAGAGIVYDSNPEAEYWETLHKAKALIDSLAR